MENDQLLWIKKIFGSEVWILILHFLCNETAILKSFLGGIPSCEGMGNSLTARAFGKVFYLSPETMPVRLD